MRTARVQAIALLAILAFAAGVSGQDAAAPSTTPAPEPSSSTLDKIDDAVDATKAGLEKAANFTTSAISEVKDAFNTTKAGVLRVVDYLKSEPQVAETGRLAAKPPAAVMTGLAPTAAAVKAAQAAAPGSTGTVGDAAVAYEGTPATGGASTKARSSDVDVFSPAELGAAAAVGDPALQSLADGIIAATAAGQADRLSSAVGKVVASAPNATVEGAADGDRSPAAGLGAAFALAMREAPAAYVNRLGGAPGVPLRANRTAIGAAFIAGLQEAAIPCAAGVGSGPAGAGPDWFKAAGQACCPLIAPALRAAQAGVDGDAGATRALYAALSDSFDLGGSQSFSLARCSTPDAKE